MSLECGRKLESLEKTPTEHLQLFKWTLKTITHVELLNLSQQQKQSGWCLKASKKAKRLTTVFLIRIVSTVILAVTPPVVRDTVVILTTEFMRSTGLFIFFFYSSAINKHTNGNGFKGAWILIYQSSTSTRNHPFLRVSQTHVRHKTCPT